MKTDDLVLPHRRDRVLKRATYTRHSRRRRDYCIRQPAGWRSHRRRHRQRHRRRHRRQSLRFLAPPPQRVATARPTSTSRRYAARNRRAPSILQFTYPHRSIDLNRSASVN